MKNGQKYGGRRFRFAKEEDIIFQLLLRLSSVICVISVFFYHYQGDRFGIYSNCVVGILASAAGCVGIYPLRPAGQRTAAGFSKSEFSHPPPGAAAVFIRV